MKVLFETNRSKIKNPEVMDTALSIIEKQSKQGFFRSKGESDFRKFNDRSIIEDAKLVELHIVKVEGKGEYKFNGNLSYNQRTKEVKFYILSVIEFDTFNYDDVKMAEFTNTANENEQEDIRELQAIIDKIKKTKPAYVPYKGPQPGQRGGPRNDRNSRGGERTRGGGSNYRGGSGGYKGNSSSSRDGGRANPKRQDLSDAEKRKKDNNNSKKNFRTDQRRNVSNNKKSSF